MAEEREVKETVTKGLTSLFTRPRKFYENVTSGRVEMTSSISEMVYIRACRDCELRATTKLVKCIIESCSNVKVALEEPIMSGTLEMIDCKNVSILINPRDSLPTITTERCETIHFHLVRPQAMGSIYSVGCKDITVHFKPPHHEENVLELPTGGSGGEDRGGGGGGGEERGGGGGGGGRGSEQFVSYLNGENIITERVVREGAGYATTATKLAEAEKKQKELMRRFEEHVVKMLNLSGLPPPPAAPASSAPPSSHPANPSSTSSTSSQPPNGSESTPQTEEEETSQSATKAERTAE